MAAMYLIYNRVTGRITGGAQGVFKEPPAGSDTEAVMEVPDGTDYAGQVVSAGVLVVDPYPPTAPPIDDPNADLAAAIGAADTLAKLKAALLGNLPGYKAKVVGRG